MKLRKLNKRGFSHDVLIVLFVVVFAIAGAGFLVASHANPVSTKSTKKTSQLKQHTIPKPHIKILSIKTSVASAIFTVHTPAPLCQSSTPTNPDGSCNCSPVGSCIVQPVQWCVSATVRFVVKTGGQVGYVYQGMTNEGIPKVANNSYAGTFPTGTCVNQSQGRSIKLFGGRDDSNGGVEVLALPKGAAPLDNGSLISDLFGGSGSVAIPGQATAYAPNTFVTVPANTGATSSTD